MSTSCDACQKNRYGLIVERLIAEGVPFFVIRSDGIPAGCGATASAPMAKSRRRSSMNSIGFAGATSMSRSVTQRGARTESPDRSISMPMLPERPAKAEKPANAASTKPTCRTRKRLL